MHHGTPVPPAAKHIKAQQMNPAIAPITVDRRRRTRRERPNKGDSGPTSEGGTRPNPQAGPSEVRGTRQRLPGQAGEATGGKTYRAEAGGKSSGHEAGTQTTSRGVRNLEDNTGGPRVHSRKAAAGDVRDTRPTWRPPRRPRPARRGQARATPAGPGEKDTTATTRAARAARLSLRTGSRPRTDEGGHVGGEGVPK